MSMTMKSYWSEILESAVFNRNSRPGRLNLNREVLELAEQIAGQLDTKVFQAKIRTSVSVAEAPAHGISVVDYAPRSKPALDFEALCGEIAGAAFPRQEEA